MTTIIDYDLTLNIYIYTLDTCACVSYIEKGPDVVCEEKDVTLTSDERLIIKLCVGSNLFFFFFYLFFLSFFFRCKRSPTSL